MSVPTLHDVFQELTSMVVGEVRYIGPVFVCRYQGGWDFMYNNIKSRHNHPVFAAYQINGYLVHAGLKPAPEADDGHYLDFNEPW
jgi:hypothetical protein